MDDIRELAEEIVQQIVEESMSHTVDDTPAVPANVPSGLEVGSELLNRSIFAIPESPTEIELRKQALLKELQVIEDAQFAQALVRRQQARNRATQLRTELIAALEEAIAIGSEIKEKYGHRLIYLRETQP